MNPYIQFGGGVCIAPLGLVTVWVVPLEEKVSRGLSVSKIGSISQEGDFPFYRRRGGERE